MYDKLNITENHLKILSLFTKGFDREYYIREVQKLCGISPRTSQIILEDLEKKLVLESSVKGKIKNYKIKKTVISKEYLSLVEQYKKILFLQNHPLILEIVEKISPLIDGIGIIFGSYAKGLEKPDSDLDIFIIGDCKGAEIEKVGDLYGIKLSVKKYPLDSFGKNIRKDILIKEVLRDHIVFLGVEKFIWEVMGNKQV